MKGRGSGARVKLSVTRAKGQSPQNTVDYDLFRLIDMYIQLLLIQSVVTIAC